MQWFAGVAMMVYVVLGVQAIVFGSESMADAGRFVSHHQVRMADAPSETWRIQLVAQQVEETQNSYRYDAKGRRDPFESLVKETPTPDSVGPICDPNRLRGPLERFDLSTLTLSGIIWGELGRRAIIRAPDGKGYFATAGMYMGQNCGQIVVIEDDRVILKEKHRDKKGNILDKTFTLPLRPEEKQQG